MKNKNSAKRILTTVLLAAMGGAIGFFAARSGILVSKQLPPSIFFTLLALAIPIFFLVIAMHEAGHAWAGSRVGFDFRLYVVGPFLWEKSTEGWTFKWNKNVNVLGGMVICVPTDRNNIQKRFAWFAAGGPLGSLAGVILFGMVQLVLPTATTPTGMILSGIITQLFWFSAVIFLITALPYHSGGFSSDGARVLRLFRGAETAQFEVLLLSIIATTMSGVRWAQVDERELDEALALAQKINAPMGVYVYAYRYYHALDRNHYELAEENLKLYMAEVDAIPKGLQNMVWMDAAFFYALIKRDQNQAFEYWKKFQATALLPKASVLAAEAAVRMVSREYEQSLQLIHQALKELPNMMDKGYALGLQERLMAMQTEIQELTLQKAS